MKITSPSLFRLGSCLAALACVSSAQVTQQAAERQSMPERSVNAMKADSGRHKPGQLHATSAFERDLAHDKAARDAAERSSTKIKFSDPSKPGTLKAILPWADLHVTGSDVAEVTVTTTLSEKGKDEPRPDGLRRLDDDVAFEFTEKANVATLQLTGESALAGQGSEFNIEVPRHTALILHSELGGDVVIENVDGDIDLTSMNGEVQLRDIGGSAVVNTMNGQITASFKTAPSKPVSFSTMNGEINLTLPTDTKANLRLRSHIGSLLTDFPEGVLKTTKVENRGGNNNSVAQEVAAAVREAAQAGREAAVAAREMAREAIREVRSANREAPVAAAPEAPEPAEPAEAPLAPLPPIPHISGGKAITGLLNGGGVDISLATMNGSITVLQAGGKVATAHAGDKPTPEAPSGQVTVTFQDPDNFTDVRDNQGGGTSEDYLELLRDYVVKAATPLLPAGERLAVTFTNIDLAGDTHVQSMRAGSNLDQVRVLTDAFPPRLHLKFQLFAADGSVRAEGERKLTDLNYLMNLHGSDRSQPLYHEKVLLKDWLRSELKPKS